MSNGRPEISKSSLLVSINIKVIRSLQDGTLARVNGLSLNLTPHTAPIDPIDFQKIIGKKIKVGPKIDHL